MLRSLLRTLLRIALVLASLVGAYAAYGFYAEPRAKRQAAELCAAVTVGENADAVLARAKEAGAERAFLRWSGAANESNGGSGYAAGDANGARNLLVIFVGLPPFSRHVCHVRATRIVSSATISHMD